MILIPSFIFVLAWIGFSIYHNIITSTISQPLAVQIAPITPDFDLTTINNLQGRTNVSPVYQLNVAGQSSTSQESTSSGSLNVTATPTPTPAPTITITPTPTITNNATVGGTLLP